MEIEDVGVKQSIGNGYGMEETDFIKIRQSDFLEQNRMIESLSLQVKILTEERDALKKEVDQLKKDNSELYGMIGKYVLLRLPSLMF